MQFTKLFIAVIASVSAVHALPAVEERETNADYNGVRSPSTSQSNQL